MGYRIQTIDDNNDVKPDIALGIDLSFNNPGIFKPLYITLDQVKANLKNLLLTRPGERYNQVTFGCNLLNILFQPSTDQLKEVISEEINAAINTWLPYVQVNTLDIKNVKDDPTLIYTIRIKLEYSVDNFSTDAIVIYADDNGLVQVE
jgi:phage baseplate assembly protein W